MIRLDEHTARCRVYTFKEGLLSAVAHDLEIDVTRFTVVIDRTAGTVEARFDATSLRVLHAIKNSQAAPLAPRDRGTIDGHIADDVLDARRFPEVRFTATVGAAQPALLAGTLALHGREHAVTVTLTRAGADHHAEATLHQPDFGIRPFSAMLGTLRIRPDVRVRLTATLPDEVPA